MCRTFPPGLFSLCSVQVSCPVPHIVWAGSTAHLFGQTKALSQWAGKILPPLPPSKGVLQAEEEGAQQRGLLQVQSFPSTCQWVWPWFPREVPTEVFSYRAFNHCPGLSTLTCPCCSLAPATVISVFCCFKPCSRISFLTLLPHTIFFLNFRNFLNLRTLWFSRVKSGEIWAKEVSHLDNPAPIEEALTMWIFWCWDVSLASPLHPWLWFSHLFSHARAKDALGMLSALLSLEGDGRTVGRKEAQHWQARMWCAARGQMLLHVCVIKCLYLPTEGKKMRAAQQGQKKIILRQKDAAATVRIAKQDYLNP